MKNKLIIFFILTLSICSAELFSNTSSLSDNKYIITYKFTEKDNPNSKEFKLYCDGNKIKLVKKDKDKNGNEVTTSTYVMIEERISYDVISSSVIKTGGKHMGVECHYIGMKWGVYIMDLDCGDKEWTIFGSELRRETIAGIDCSVREVTLGAYGGTTYYFYNNNLMLKKQNPAVTMQAISIDENPTFAPDEFVIPSDVQWY